MKTQLTDYELYQWRQKELLTQGALIDESLRITETAHQLREAARQVTEAARREGRREGEKIGVIYLCERLLNWPATPKEQLTALSLEELARLAEELQAEALKKGSAN